MQAPAREISVEGMRETYAISWREAEGRVYSGKLEVEARGLRLAGATGQGAAALEIPFGDLSVVRVGRSPAERMDGRVTLVLERRAQGPVRIASVAQTGIVSELAERLASLRPGPAAPMKRAVVVVPIREGVHEHVRKLVEQGPPFDRPRPDSSAISSSSRMARSSSSSREPERRPSACSATRALS